MSHVVTCEVAVKNIPVLQEFIHNHAHNVKDLGTGTFALFDGAEVVGHGFQLDGWSYPLVVNTETGELSYDNYNGCWGKQEHLDKLMHGYSQAVMEQEAYLAGHAIERETLEDGQVRLTITPLS